MARFGEYSKRELIALQGKNSSAKRSYPVLLRAGIIFQRFQQFLLRAESYFEFDIGNVENVFCAAEALKEIGQDEIGFGDETFRIDILIKSIKLWLWKIYHRCPLVDNKEKLDAFKAFVEIIKQIGPEHFAVITTNYNLVLEYSAYTNGIRCSYPNCAYKVISLLGSDREKYLSADKNALQVSKVHGSINYFSDNESLCLFDDVAISGDSIGGSKITKTQTPRPAIFMLDSIWKIKKENASLSPAIIPPTYAKVQRAE